LPGIITTTGCAIGETRRDLSLPAFFDILEVRRRIHECFELCRQAAHVGGSAHDDRVCAIENVPPAGCLIRWDKLNACAIDSSRATSDCLGDLDGVTISAVIDHNDFDGD
jgi:hypothetical protein